MVELRFVGFLTFLHCECSTVVYGRSRVSKDEKKTQHTIQIPSFVHFLYMNCNVQYLYEASYLVPTLGFLSKNR